MTQFTSYRQDRTTSCATCDCKEFAQSQESRQAQAVYQAEYAKWSQEQTEKRNAEIDAKGFCDMLGKTIAVGDTIAWPTSAGRAIGMTVGRITKINKKDKRNTHSGRNWTISAKPIKAAYDGHYYSKTKWNPETKQHEERDDGIPAVTIQKVQNVVKVTLSDQMSFDEAT